MFVTGSKVSKVPPPASLYLCGEPLPWVDTCDHLGNKLCSDGKMSQDVKEKLATFIDSSVKTREMFSFANPYEQIKAMEKYCLSFYGSATWRLEECIDSFSASWKTAIKLAWDVPRACRSYFLGTVLAPSTISVRSSLLSRSHGFFCSLLESPSHEVSTVARICARDLRSNLGSNLSLIQRETGLDPWVSSRLQMKDCLKTHVCSKVPTEDSWRPQFLVKLLSARLESHYGGDVEEVSRLTNMINGLVIN